MRLAAIIRKAVGIFFSVQFVKFLLAGGTAAVFNFISFIFIRQYLPRIISIVLAFVIGTFVSFILNKIFTFKAKDEKTLIQSVKFAFVAIAGYLLAIAVSVVLTCLYNLIGITVLTPEKVEGIIHLMTIGIITLYNFLAMKYFSFKKLSKPVKPYKTMFIKEER